jgi:hypothetical protein
MSPVLPTKTSPPEASASNSGVAAPIITRILLGVPAALSGEVYTFVDCAKHNASMTAEPFGIRVLTKSMPSKQGRDFLIPWSNVAAVVYPPPPGLQRLDPYGKPVGQVGATN